MKPSMSVKKNGLDGYHAGLTKRVNSLQAFFNRNIFRMYQKAQIRRWETENKSETGQWKPLEPNYRRQKLSRFASFPGHGSKLMIAKGDLVKAAQGTGKGFRKIATNHGLTVALDADFVGGKIHTIAGRPVMKFGRNTIDQMKQALKIYMTTGIVKGGD